MTFRSRTNSCRPHYVDEGRGEKAGGRDHQRRYRRINEDELKLVHASPPVLGIFISRSATTRNSSAIMFADRPTHSLQIAQDGEAMIRNTSVGGLPQNEQFMMRL